jgi:phosphoenolpyruvate carboxykinase (GTP)
MGDYFQHWLNMGDKLGKNAPRIFYVNWFRKSVAGKFLWPGFGENSRVLKWMCDRIDGKASARETSIGLIPEAGDLDLNGLSIPQENLQELLKVEVDVWKDEIPSLEEHFAQFKDRLPKRIMQQLDDLKVRLNK